MFAIKPLSISLALAVSPMTMATANTLSPEELAWYLHPPTLEEYLYLPPYKVQYVEMTLRYTDTTFIEGAVWSSEETEEPYDFGGTFDSLSSAEDPWGIPQPYDITPGTALQFSALYYTEYALREEPEWGTTYVLMQCSLEVIGCDDFLGGYSSDRWDEEHAYSFDDSGFAFSYWDNSIWGELTVGGDFRYDEWYTTDFVNFTATDGTPATATFLAWALNFEVVEYRYVTAGNWDYVPTVPAPAAALLLPSGLIALAAFRRRRKS